MAPSAVGAKRVPDVAPPWQNELPGPTCASTVSQMGRQGPGCSRRRRGHRIRSMQIPVPHRKWANPAQASLRVFLPLHSVSGSALQAPWVFTGSCSGTPRATARATSAAARQGLFVSVAAPRRPPSIPGFALDELETRHVCAFSQGRVDVDDLVDVPWRCPRPFALLERRRLPTAGRRCTWCRCLRFTPRRRSRFASDDIVSASREVGLFGDLPPGSAGSA